MSEILSSKVGTFTLTVANSPFIINAADGVKVVAMKLLSGSGSYVGDMPVDGIASGAIALVVNEPCTIGGDQPIEYLQIIIDSGSILNVITRS